MWARFAYDAEDNRAVVLDAKGRYTYFAYDDLNRLAEYEIGYGQSTRVTPPNATSGITPTEESAGERDQGRLKSFLEQCKCKGF